MLLSILNYVSVANQLLQPIIFCRHHIFEGWHMVAVEIMLKFRFYAMMLQNVTLMARPALEKSAHSPHACCTRFQFSGG